jgi:uncharacterized membrane protein
MLEETTSDARDYDLERLVMLSDGVFAIAITLLVLDLKAPADWDGTVVGLLRAMSLSLSAYAISFLSIAIYWVMHRRCFKRYMRADYMLTLLNFFVLGLVTLLPFGTRLLVQFGASKGSNLIYCGLIAAIGVASAMQWAWAAFFGRLVDTGIGRGFRIYLFCNLLIIPSLMTAIGLLSMRSGSYWLYGVVALIMFGLRWVRRKLLPGDLA